ncbi:MAG: hypothetical protein KPEEDBHJ_02927 [Anaerolineales bacterium]|nr:hypothetical protein [Anaerolineales bacterium]
MNQPPPPDNFNSTSSPSPSEGTPPSAPGPVAWTANDSWLGLGALLLLTAGFLFALAQLPQTRMSGLAALSLFEFIPLIPVAVILAYRKASWVELGLRRFDRNALSLGCGLLVAVYILVILNNLVMVALKIVTQADAIMELLDEIQSPLLFAFVTAFVAPVTEELFFRGFLFQGLRAKYGWVNALMFSSIIFALFHGQIATLIPTFLLGALFSYMVQRSGSIFPSMVLHFVVNSMGVCAMLAASQFGIT